MQVNSIDIGVELILETGTDISDAVTAGILYKKPNGISGFWLGIVKDKTKISCTLGNNKIQEAAELLRKHFYDL